MNSESLCSRKYRTAQINVLLGTASFAVLVAGGVAQAQSQTAVAPVEEVLVTGSLIRGTAAVGVPVTALSSQDFRETGQLSVTDTLKIVPSLSIDAEASPAFGGGQLSFEQNIQIHGIDTGQAGTETLLLIDGLRWPPQNYKSDTVNPSIIPQIAISRVDVLAAGASAEYGSDAAAGVINVILKRGYDGAMTQGSFDAAPGVGYHSVQFSQLYGKSWDTGNITVSYEVTDKSRLATDARDYYTLDFTPWGLMNLNPLGSSIPGIVSVGKPATTPGAPAGFAATSGTMFCANCYSIPAGQDGTHLTWAQILANPGVKNERNPWLNSDARPHLQTNAATGTLDQKLVNDFFGLGPVSLFGEAVYSNQRGKQVYAPGNGDARAVLASVTVPTNNPFYPAGAPKGLQVNYSLALEVPTIVTGGEVAGRYVAGFNLDKLPFDWRGKLTYSMTDDQNFGNISNDINKNNLSAAVGNTITDSSGVLAPYTKPATVPYFNAFCDPSAFKTCNSPTTLNYIVGFRNQASHFKVQETDANFDGPLFDLPGGTVRAAIAAQHLSEHAVFTAVGNASTASTAIISNSVDPEKQSSNAFFGQIDVPVIGKANALPFVESLDIEGGYRYDKYSNVNDPVYTPKLSANWGVGGGLTVRAAWGKSFRVPSFAENSPISSGIEGANALGGSPGVTSDVVVLGCGSVNGSPAGAALPGSLTAALNPTCSSDPTLRTPGGLVISATGGGAAVIVRHGQTLSPESTRQWDMGFNFSPTEPILGVNLSGLDLDVTLFHLSFQNVVSNQRFGQGADDPASLLQFTVIPNPSLPITDPSNAAFYSLVKQVAGLQTTGNVFDPTFTTNVKFIYDTALRNIGSREFGGIDFNGRYDWDLGDLGSVNIGASGYYALVDKSRATALSPISDVYRGMNSGNRLKRVRYRLGWANESWNITGFADYMGHGAINTGGNSLIPPCYYQVGFAPGSCYAGSPFYGPYNVFPNGSPATVLFDLSLGYQTGEAPQNEYLRNIGFQLTVNNVLDKAPPFQVGVKGSGTGLRAFDTSYSDLQREVNFTVTKVW